jgi:hypothetical protein
MVWILRLKDFVEALIHVDPAHVVRTDHPGVTTMWLTPLDMRVTHIIHSEDDCYKSLFAARVPIAISVSFARSLSEYSLIAG